MAYGYVSPTYGFTIEMWFKTDATSAGFRTLFNSRTQASVTWQGGGATTTAIGRQMVVGLQATTGALQVTIVNESNTSGTAVLTYTDPSPAGYHADNEWHHLAIRLGTNRQTYTFFLDGAVLATGNTSSAVSWKPSVQTFGAEYAPHVGDFGSNLWDKWLAYFAMYEKPLSDNRILEHYTAGAGGTVYYGDDEVTRLHRIASWADVPEQSREFQEPLVVLQGIQVSGTNALNAMQDTAFYAGGIVYADGQSRMVYHNRRHSYNRWNVATFAESSTSAPEIGMTFTLDDANILNDVRGERPYGSQVRLVDDLSRAAYGRKVYSFSISVTTQEELQNAVSWIAAKYRDASVRVSEITLRAESSDLIEWAGTGGLQIGDHITFDELPTDAAPEVTMEFIVEQISLDVDMGNQIWKLSLELSPYTFQRVFQVGVSTLGSEDRIAYQEE